MNNVKKILYLFLALLLPALIFVFLKYAGRNEFNIPIYHEQGVPHPPQACTEAYAIPYRVPDAPWRFSQYKATVIIFPADGLDRQKLESRINDELGAGIVKIIISEVLSSDPDHVLQLRNCVFLLNDPSQAVLIDGDDRIRGYYDLRSREEEDRLRVELKILLKKY